MTMEKRLTQNMVRNFLKLHTWDRELQNKIADVLKDALPEEEPDEGYEAVAAMLACLHDDFELWDPENTRPETRMDILRDHADALFIDGMVYGAYLAKRTGEEE